MYWSRYLFCCCNCAGLCFVHIRWHMQTMSNLDILPKSCHLSLTKVRKGKQNPCTLLFVRCVWCLLTSGSVSFSLGQTTSIKPFPLIGLLPQQHMSQYYRYHGSLTTPPCSQAVVWTLFEVPIQISWSQVGPSTTSRISNCMHFSLLVTRSWMVCNAVATLFPISWSGWLRGSMPVRRMKTTPRPSTTTFDTCTPLIVARYTHPSMLSYLIATLAVSSILLFQLLYL